MLDDRISGDEMRAFIVCADNEPEWLLYDGQGWCRDQRGAFKTYQIVPAPPNGLPVLPKYTRCEHQDLEILRKSGFNTFAFMHISNLKKDRANNKIN